MTPHSTSPVSLEYSFPGRWVGGTALVLGPSLWLVGLVLRLPFHFFFPQQLQAYHEAPGRITAAYGCVLFGGIVTSLGVITLATEISRSRPLWATWGGVLVLLGLFTRAFHARSIIWRFSSCRSSARLRRRRSSAGRMARS